MLASWVAAAGELGEAGREGLGWIYLSSGLSCHHSASRSICQRGRESRPTRAVPTGRFRTEQSTTPDRFKTDPNTFTLTEEQIRQLALVMWRPPAAAPPVWPSFWVF